MILSISNLKYYFNNIFLINFNIFNQFNYYYRAQLNIYNCKKIRLRYRRSRKLLDTVIKRLKSYKLIKLKMIQRKKRLFEKKLN